MVVLVVVERLLLSLQEIMQIAMCWLSRVVVVESQVIAQT